MLQMIISCSAYLFAFYMGRYTHDGSLTPTLLGVGVTFFVVSALEIRRRMKS